MNTLGLIGAVLFGTVISICTVGVSSAMPVAKHVGATAGDDIIEVRGGRGGGGGAARAGGGRASVARAGGGRATVARGGSVSRTNVAARRSTNVNRRTNVNVNRANVNVVGRPPVRGWVARPYYGTIVGGVALGTMIAVTAGAVPAAPASNLCWFWADSAQVNGYWDYCVAP
jgi:hypothetical protein